MGTVTDTITNVLILISIVLMGIITYRESSKEIAVLRGRLMETDNTVRSLRDTNSRLNYLEWRLNHPEFTFENEASGCVIVRYNDHSVACVNKKLVGYYGASHATGTIEFLNSTKLPIHLAMELKDFTEKYGTQLFK